MDKKTVFVTSIVMIIGTVACDHKKEVKYVEVEKVKTLECSKQEDFSIADNRVVQMKNVNLERVHQRTRRLDCSGKIISEKMEVFTETTKDIKIFSEKKLFPGASNRRRNFTEQAELNEKVSEQLKYLKGTAFNRQTCESAKRSPINAVAEKMVRQGVAVFTLGLAQDEEVKRRQPSITM
ncbi:MAG: hypothetical protein KDD40_09920, partial [Bdellovibrionales bacterium]|nr:hypothetical protein [Bdellovibrionales bacterium]